MKKAIFIPFLILLFSCSKEKLDQKYLKLEGDWEYQKVEYVDNNNNLYDETNAYKNDVLSFTSTKSVEFKEEGKNIVYGSWSEFAGCITFDFDNTTLPLFKEIEFTGHDYENNGNIVTFNYEYLDGTLYYTLKKIQPIIENEDDDHDHKEDPKGNPTRRRS